MKLVLPLLLIVGLAVGYNYALVAHGPDLHKAIHGPSKTTKPARRSWN